MADILLLEPPYSNKYPPLGLMKIAYFHKYIMNDYVRFSKGPLPEALKDKKWDRVYVCTLFTFEWENTKKTIEYAFSVVKDETRVFTGGILATLMPKLVKETFPKVTNIEGLLNRKGTLGLDREEEIDTLPLEYSILEDVEYEYPSHNAYFTYMTRGCGMRCGFCAVQTLEPNYIPYISIKNSIARIEKEYGPKKDLLLMDNNVLISPHFNKIIDEIKELGFYKGATFINPKTHKKINRYVDFNQGLDAKLLTEEKAKKLGEIAIYPARIAFDHIEDKEYYVRAIKRCAKYGIDNMSNYLLYNGDDFSGKGSQYHADTPEDLYLRMRISLDLCDELSNEYRRKISIFSFPMRYIPLSDTKRGYIGKNWNLKYLRAVQRMMIPTQGKGVSSKSFFEAAFGKNENEFVEFLAMPESLLGMRGNFVEKKDEPENERITRYTEWEKHKTLVKNWIEQYRDLKDEKSDFVSVIGTNIFNYDTYKLLKSEKQKRLFVYYFTLSGALLAIADELKDGQATILTNIKKDPILYNEIIKHIVSVKVANSLIAPLITLLGKEFLYDLLASFDVLESKKVFVFDNLAKAQLKAGVNYLDCKMVKYAQLFESAGVFSKTTREYTIELIKNLENVELQKVLLQNLESFKAKMINSVHDQAANSFIVNEIENNINKLYEQLTLF